jgi:hypothetical protein
VRFAAHQCSIAIVVSTLSVMREHVRTVPYRESLVSRAEMDNDAARHSYVANQDRVPPQAREYPVPTGISRVPDPSFGRDGLSRLRVALLLFHNHWHAIIRRIFRGFPSPSVFFQFLCIDLIIIHDSLLPKENGFTNGMSASVP